MRLSPLGAGNCQFVYRIDRDSWKSPEDRSVPWHQCYVLKLPRKADSATIMRRMLYHDELCLFMQEGYRNNAESCAPKRVCCLVDRTVADRLRSHLSKLLDDYKTCTQNATCRRNRTKVSRDVTASVNREKVNMFHTEIVYKKRIYHVKEVALQTAVDVDPRAICILGNKKVVYDPSKHELAILEEDLFNLAVCMSLGRTLLQAGMQHYRNISVELKPKCGLLNFSGLPSLFQMSQPYKARIRYQNIIPSDTPKVAASILKRDPGNLTLSKYSPIRLFRMTLNDVKKELDYLARAPQNNIRIFIDNIEVDPGVLLSDTYAMDNVARCLLENKLTMTRVLNLQALASGQQVVAHVVYLLSRLLTQVTVPKGNAGEDTARKVKFSTIMNNLLCLSKELLDLMLCNHSNAYRIQRAFNFIGRRLICSLCNVLKMLLANRRIMIYTSRRNTSMERLRTTKGNRSLPVFHNDAQALCHKLTIYSQGRLWKRQCSNDEAVQLVVFNELECLLTQIHRCVTYRPANPKGSVVRGKTSPIVGTTCSGEKMERVLIKKSTALIGAAKRWIQLYLGGRTAMDISVVLNVLFHGQPDNAANGPNFFRFSLIDLDLKPAHRIPRWKEDVLFLINQQQHY
ncbi:uncharacterized protein BXIN_0966 [Babesia sp. Xinjiang]|uniref:uncharacterized protein n=1 Tax=Babesia sp. Xinjiang TaxID=462227 RepID=UPI000A257F94|nr:uncharacterized protein BXIN_0966 [Babesia sp. Xinjiang]ORM42189.1 hypothetical protein BXIN_0966 [Babesia sp. Xinjiang]